MSFRVLVLRCAKTVRTKRWSHWHRQDDGGMQETPDQTNKETSLLYQRVFSRLNSRIVTLVWVFECWFCDARKTVKKKSWSHWHGQDDGVYARNQPQIKQTKKQAYFTIEFFQDWTLELSHLYEFSSAGFVMRKKWLRRKGGKFEWFCLIQGTYARSAKNMADTWQPTFFQ